MTFYIVTQRSLVAILDGNFTKPPEGESYMEEANHSYPGHFTIPSATSNTLISHVQFLEIVTQSLR